MPKTAEGNIGVGVVFLRHLLREFGGDERLALAAYYQGASAVREHGLFPRRARTSADQVAEGPRLTETCPGRVPRDTVPDTARSVSGARRRCRSNCASSVEPLSASVELAPPETACATWSK